jgi:hypothetical protein
MLSIGHLNGGEFASPQELCQHFGVTTVGFDVITRPRGDQ